jgi:DNA polymerase sigma
MKRKRIEDNSSFPVFKLTPLHIECQSLANILFPLPEETEVRDRTIRQITDSIYNFWHGIRINVFGSYANNIHTPLGYFYF